MASDNDWTSWPERILGAAAALGGMLVFARRWLGRWYRAIVLLHAFGEHFGENAPATIERLLANIDRTQGRGEVERRLLAEHLRLALYVCSPDGACTAANEPLCELFGLDSSEFLGFGWLAAIEDRLAVYQDWIRSVTNGLPFSREYDAVNKRTGERVHCRSKAYAVLASDGTVVCYVGYVERIEK